MRSLRCPIIFGNEPDKSATLVSGCEEAVVAVTLPAVAAGARRCHLGWWRFPALVIAFPPAFLFDALTLPVQTLLAAAKGMHAIGGP